MTQYRIINTIGGTDLGTYEAASPEAALDAMARDTGYKDYGTLAADCTALRDKLAAANALLVRVPFSALTPELAWAIDTHLAGQPAAPERKSVKLVGGKLVSATDGEHEAHFYTLPSDCIVHIDAHTAADQRVLDAMSEARIVIDHGLPIFDDSLSEIHVCEAELARREGKPPPKAVVPAMTAGFAGGTNSTSSGTSENRNPWEQLPRPKKP